MYQTLNSRSIPKFTVKEETKEKINEEVKEILSEKDSSIESNASKEDNTVYEKNKMKFVMDTLNRSCDLYKLMHNEMCSTNESMMVLINKMNDFENNLVELNIKINDLQDKLKSKSQTPSESPSPPLNLRRKSILEISANSPRPMIKKTASSSSLRSTNSFKK